MNERITEQGFQTRWPVKWMKDTGTCLYGIPIMSYDSNNSNQTLMHGSVSHSEPKSFQACIFTTNSYLGLGKNLDLEMEVKKTISEYGTGSHGVRLLSGTTAIHIEAEQEISKFLGVEAAMLFSSGFIANVSTISNLTNDPDDVLILDAFAHSSIVDGAGLSKAKVFRFNHNDMNHLERILKSVRSSPIPPRRILVAVDGVYSMHGDICDLPKLVALCKQYEALSYVDEAHSFCSIGKTGRGITEHFGMDPTSVDFIMGSLSKSIPTSGGFVAGKKKLIDYLRFEARGYIYSTGMSVPCAAVTKHTLQFLQRDTTTVERLHENINIFGSILKSRGIIVHHNQTPLFPMFIGNEELAYLTAAFCLEQGVFVNAIPYPVVPKEHALLRVSVNANHTIEQLEKCADTLLQAAIKFQLPILANTQCFRNSKL